MKDRKAITRYAIYRVSGNQGKQSTSVVLDENYNVKTYRSALQSDSEAVRMNNEREKYGNNVVFISKPLKSFIAA